MTKKLRQNQQEKVKTGFWSLSQNKILYSLFYLLILFLPTELGKHFWPIFSFVFGLRLDYLSPTLYLTDILIFSIFLFSFPKLFKVIKKTDKKYLLGFVFILVCLIFGTVGAKNQLAGIYGIIKLLEYSLLTIFVIYNFKNFNKTILFFCFLTGIVVESILAFLQCFSQGSINGLFYFLGERAFNAQTPGIANASINGQLFLRPYATFPHPNVLAGFLIIAMAYLFLLSPKIKKQYLILGVIIGTLTLLLTLSRTVILLWLSYLIIFFGTSFFKKYKNMVSNPELILGAVIFFVLIVFGYFAFQNNPFLQRFSLTKISDESIVQRQELINQSLVMFAKSPILGVGVNNFFSNLDFNNAKLIALLIQPVHNIFLLVLAETGLVGFCFFVYLFYKSLRADLTKLKKEKGWLLMMLFAIIFLGMFDHYFLTLQQGQIMLSIVFGTALASKETMV